MLTLRTPTLLAPAGDWDCVKAAVENGADAVYFGLSRFNARMRAHNFTDDDLPEVMDYLHQRGVKGYVTLNTLVFPQELADAERYIRHIIESNVDAVIVQDVGICQLIRHISPDFPIHASTQMTVTSAQGVAFANDLGCEVVVLARECSLKEMAKIQAQLGERHITMPLEVFVHGALCVAYSGQCLTSESLGGRSANRGECAQACRMTYDLVVDGNVMDLGDRQYLLSPQDLSGLEVLPDLIRNGIACLKIEGRLKQPEYVANVTRIYREGIDRAIAQAESDRATQDSQRYQLEMAFSRGLYTGWLNGINNKELVHARFGKKRGVYLGEVLRIDTHTAGSSPQRSEGRSQNKHHASKQQKSHYRNKTNKGLHTKSQGSKQYNTRPKKLTNPEITVQIHAPLKAGDGVMFDSGHPNGKEEGGRVYTVKQKGNRATLTFGRDTIDVRRIQPGDGLWKTSDPALEKEVRQSFAGDKPHFQRPISITITGKAGEPLTAIAHDSPHPSNDSAGAIVTIQSAMALVSAHSNPLDSDRLQQQFSRLGNTPFYLESLTNELEGQAMIPVSELNRLRRSLVEQLLEVRSRPKGWMINDNHTVADLLARCIEYKAEDTASDLIASSMGYAVANPSYATSPTPTLIPLVRTFEQLAATLAAGIKTIYCELEDPRRYREAVRLVREESDRSGHEHQLWVAPPRITKASENYLLDQVLRCQADGYLVRNYDHLAYFADQRCIGDFSLNVANPITASYFLNKFHLERLTASYDLNIQQLDQLLTACPQGWFEVTLHQHMPMFHMEHCVFCTFLSEGTDASNCGRPCDRYEVELRDRTGAKHVLHADAGCRNTVYNSRAQTGAEFAHRLIESGLRYVRIEFLKDSGDDVKQAIALYQDVIDGAISGAEVWKRLKLQNQLGVTRGQL